MFNVLEIMIFLHCVDDTKGQVRILHLEMEIAKTKLKVASLNFLYAKGPFRTKAVVKTKNKKQRTAHKTATKIQIRPFAAN